MDDNFDDKNNLPEEPFKASAEEWSKEQPSPAEPAKPESETNRWGSPENSGPEDPNRWHGELYSPGADQPAGQGTSTAPETVVITEPTSAAEPPKKKEGFPVWAIVLIVLLVLGLCVLCPILVVLGGLINFAQGAAILLPFI
jgi:hypothetical protein